MSTLLRLLLEAVKGALGRADRIINGLQAKCSNLEEANATLQGQVGQLTALVKAAEAEKEASDQAITDTLTEIKAYTLPDLEADVASAVNENDSDNPSQMTDDFIEAVVDNPDTGLSAEDVPTVGSEEVTPDTETNAAIESVLKSAETAEN